MLCGTCFRMLRGQDGRIWRGTYDLQFNHHLSVKDLRGSAEMHCRICRVLYEELQSKFEARTEVLVLQAHGRPQLLLSTLRNHWFAVQMFEFLSFFRIIGLLSYIRTVSRFMSRSETQRIEKVADTDSLDELALSNLVSLSVDHHRVTEDVQKTGQLYFLDFKLKCAHVRCRRTFAFRRTTDARDPQFRTPQSKVTSSDEVYQLCRQWIHRCKCVPAEKIPEWYPARLISLEELKGRNSADKLEGWEQKCSVRLIETAKWKGAGAGPGHRHVCYVTLSHCWGPNPSRAHQLTSENIGTYRSGVKLSTLPATFRHAIEFAARIRNVGFIWIDSLCILQGDETDWLEQSKLMEKIYSNTYLNISATDAVNNEQGLFRERDPESLLEDEVILNVSGLPGVDKADQLDAISEAQTFGTIAPGSSEILDLSGSAILRSKAQLRRCTILDVSFWANHVDRSPVNRRGWVLQERLMAPRILHFCKDQVAWECREFDVAEGLPQDMPNLQLTASGVVEDSRLKGVDEKGIKKGGERLRRARLDGLQDPDEHLKPQIFAFEMWSRIVETYSLTAITNWQDKLIALSGLARWMSREMQQTSTPLPLAQSSLVTQPDSIITAPIYVAGLWKQHLASQLLWRVDPVFQETNGSFENPSTAAQEYRAPSFSWASIDAHNGRGIKYAEVTDQDLYISIEEVGVTPQKGSDIFGILTGAHLIIRGKLRRVVMHENAKKAGRYSWKLMGRGELDDEEHRNVYLDCPSRDAKRILGRDADVFLVPAAKGDRLASEWSKYLICLLLQLDKSSEKENAFRRIGITKLSPWADSKALDEYEVDAGGTCVRTGIPRILKTEDSDVNMPHQGDYDGTGMHRILLI